MDITENEPKLENSADASEKKIPDEAKPIIDKLESQIASIVKGFNQVFKDNGVPEATIGKFQYIIQISISSKPRPFPEPDTDSAPEGHSPDSGDRIIRVEGNCGPVIDENGITHYPPCVLVIKS
jgi:hypothetical protein